MKLKLNYNFLYLCSNYKTLTIMKKVMKKIKHTRITQMPNQVVDITKLNGKKWLTRAQAEKECIAIDNLSGINYIVISQFSEINPN